MRRPVRNLLLVCSMLTAGVAGAAVNTYSTSPALVVPDVSTVMSTINVPDTGTLNSITVTHEDPAAVGKLLKAAVDAGANSVSGVGFAVSDPARGRDGALQAAFADARAKADVLARAAGRTVGRALTIVEGGGVRPPVPMQYEMKAMSRSADMPVEPGAEELSFTVSVVFELR